MPVFGPEILLSRARVSRTHSNSNSDSDTASFADAILKVFESCEDSIYQNRAKRTIFSRIPTSEIRVESMWSVALRCAEKCLRRTVMRKSAA